MIKKLESNSLSRTALIFKMAMDKNTQYIRHYQKLLSTFTSSDSCYQFYLNEHKDKLMSDMEKKALSQTYSILNDYILINATLSSIS